MRAADHLLTPPTAGEPYDLAYHQREGLKLIGARSGEPATVVLAHLDEYFAARRRRVPRADERSEREGSAVLGCVLGQLLVRAGWRWVTLVWKSGAPVEAIVEADQYGRDSSISFGVSDPDAAWLVLPMQDVARVYTRRRTPVAFAASWKRMQGAARPEAGALELFELAPAQR